MNNDSCIAEGIKLKKASMFRSSLIHISGCILNLKASFEGWEMTPMLPLAWSISLLHLEVGLALYVIPNRASQELEGLLWRLLPPFKGEHLERTQTSQIAPFLRPRASPWIPTWLVENFQLARILHYAWVNHNGKVGNPNSITILNQKPILEWYVVRCGSNKGYQKDMWLKEIGLHAQSIITILSSIGSIIGERGHVWPFDELKNLHFGMNMIFIWALKIMRTAATASIWICKQSFHILGEAN